MNIQQNEFAAVQHHKVCVSNLSVEQVGLHVKNVFDTRNTSQFDSVLLLTNGKIRVSDMSNDIFAEYTAPHMIIMEKNKEYVVETLEDYSLFYDIGALRTSTGDIVDPDNLVRANYPFDPSKPFEEQQNGSN